MGIKNHITFIKKSLLDLVFSAVRVGVDPEAEIMRALMQVLKVLDPNLGYSLTFWSIPVITMLTSILASYLYGDALGIIAVGLVFWEEFS